MYDFLKKVPLFADLPEADLDRLCEMVQEVRLPAGQDLFAEGSPGDRAYVIQTGELEIIKTSAGRPVLLAVRHAGEVIGEMALLEEAPRIATVRARSDCILLAIGQEQLDHLLNTSPSASRAMLHTVLARWRNVTASMRQSEKMAQLGTLTAGVAHELNNPAAAARRSADQLQGAIEHFGRAQRDLSRLALTADQQARLEDLATRMESLARQPLALDALARSDREADLEEWLDAQGLPEAWDLAPTLVNLDFDAPTLAEAAAPFEPDHLPILIDWLTTSYTTRSLLAEIGQATSRISDIVKALKSYSYLDQAPVQTVDVHEGLNSTLVILHNKLSAINVRRDFAPDVPKIQAYGSELNQVWTNILDNAADALAGRPNPQITLLTRHDGEWVMVEITDNGPGIPSAIQPRVFEAFFTTKPPGKGTGLGLDISYNIVANKHHGDIKVFSQLGRTSFQVLLPVNFETASGIPPTMDIIPQAGDDEMRRILETAHTIAVVGISAREDRPAYRVPAYLQAHGYRIIPVNPTLSEVLGEKAYPDLAAVPEAIDVVQIFRRSEEVMPHVVEAVDSGAKVVWMQEGIINEQAAEVARAAGLEVVMNACMRATHRRLLEPSQP